MTGTVDEGNRIYGVYLSSTVNNTIGGSEVGARKCNFGERHRRHSIAHGQWKHDTRQLHRNGRNWNSRPREWLLRCRLSPNTTNNTIGGSEVGARNVISGNDGYGIRVLGGK